MNTPTYEVVASDVRSATRDLDDVIDELEQLALDIVRKLEPVLGPRLDDEDFDRHELRRALVDLARIPERLAELRDALDEALE